jgi:hypothetical protein
LSSLKVTGLPQKSEEQFADLQELLASLQRIIFHKPISICLIPKFLFRNGI